MVTELLTKNQHQAAEAREPLSLHWVDQEPLARKAARSNDASAVWATQEPRLARRIVQETSWSPSRKAGFLILIGKPSFEVLPALERRFVRVVYMVKGNNCLAREELKAVLKSPDRRDRFVGGMVDKEAEIVTLWRGDLTSLVVPFSAFTPTANDIRPDWDQFTVTDYGHTLRFGHYEAAADAVLYEYAPEFRRRLKKARIASERTLGASIRRLRMQRQLTQRDFPGIPAKTLARIERGEVAKPHNDTLEAIAKQLGVLVEDLPTY
jgi:DNA-binding Xre family transcriptional regulator